jgi:hypothetical protein
VIRKIGRGKYSEVFEGVNMRTTNMCVIKVRTTREEYKHIIETGRRNAAREGGGQHTGGERERGIRRSHSIAIDASIGASVARASLPASYLGAGMSTCEQG